eukprot:1176483-Prorocentrum_minimum.AAC.1
MGVEAEVEVEVEGAGAAGGGEVGGVWSMESLMHRSCTGGDRRGKGKRHKTRDWGGCSARQSGECEKLKTLIVGA